MDEKSDAFDGLLRFESLRTTITDICNNMLSSSAVIPNCTETIQELKAEAEKLNSELLDLWRKAESEPYPWSDPESYKVSYKKACTAVAQHNATLKKRHKATLIRFADWLSRQKENALGGLELYAVTRADAVKEIRSLIGADRSSEFPGIEFPTPRAWWEWWQNRIENQQWQEIVDNLKNRLQLVNFANVLIGRMIDPQFPKEDISETTTTPPALNIPPSSDLTRDSRPSRPLPVKEPGASPALPSLPRDLNSMNVFYDQVPEGNDINSVVPLLSRTESGRFITRAPEPVPVVGGGIPENTSQKSLDEEKPESKGAARTEEEVITSPQPDTREAEVAAPPPAPEDSPDADTGVGEDVANAATEVMAYVTSESDGECVAHVSEMNDSEDAAITQEPATDTIANQFWRAIDYGRLDIAYYLSLSSVPAESVLPPALVKALQLANYYVHFKGSDAQATEYENSIYEASPYFQDDESVPDSKSRGLLAIAVTLIPFFANSGIHEARRILRFGRDHFTDIPELIEIVNLAETYATLCSNIEPLLAKSDRLTWEEMMQDFHQRYRVWYNTAEKKNFNFHGATLVWKEWLNKSNLGRVLTEMHQPHASNIAKLSAICQRWRGHNFEKRLKETDKRTSAVARKESRITATAKKDLENHTLKFLEFFDEWKNLIISRQPSISDLRAKLDNTRLTLLEKLPIVLERILSIRKTRPDDPLSKPCLTLLEQSCIALRDLVNNGLTSRSQRSIAIHINRGLLTVPEVIMAPDLWSAESDGIDAELLSGFTDNSRNIADAVKKQIEALNFRSARALIEFLEENQSGDFQALAKLMDNNLDEAIKELEGRKDAVQREVQSAYSDTLLTEDERLDMEKWLDFDAASCDTFAPQRAKVEEINEECRTRRAARIEELRSRWNEKRDGADERTKKLIDAALNADDILVLEDYLGRLDAGESLPENNESRNLGFFPDFIRRLKNRYGGKVPLIRHFLTESSDRNVINFREMSLTARKRAMELLDEWDELQRSQNNGDQQAYHIGKVFTSIGFDVVEVNVISAEKNTMVGVYDMQTSVLSSRELCPIPRFGSEANGRYRVLCLWGSPEVSKIREYISRNKSQMMPTIVIFTTLMEETRRRALAKECRQDDPRTSFLLLDSFLVLYLCSLKSDRLSAFFTSTLPFAPGQPYNYTNTAGIPPEMFYGRTKQLMDICDPKGSNLVYGGRQLGKTALLHAAAQELHNPEKGSIALRIDLKDAHLPTTDVTGSLWSILSRLLNDYGVMTSGVTSQDKFRSRIVDWLKEDSQRSICLLLDEADAFLKADGEGKYATTKEDTRRWHLVGGLKEIMDATNGRFKVVFAGLHNVQRTARDPNTPLAHLGDPICVGAFVGDDAPVALKMITLPLETLGYRFENKTLPLKILIHTNYYPSLIQVFCNKLIEYLRKKNSFNFQEVPPYIIRDADVQEAYLMSREDVVKRFNWSLDLDRRYKILALILAFELDTDSARKNGVSVQRLREQALYWWEAGFGVDAGLDHFRVLLDEMIGLGILRTTAPDYYTLRSNNVIKLMGSRSSIEEQLCSESDYLPDEPFDPSDDYTLLGGPDGERLRSPFKTLDERRLYDSGTNVNIVFGCRAAGLDYVVQALKKLEGGEAVRIVDSITSKGTFQELVKSVLEKRPKLWQALVVAPGVNWEIDLAHYALRIGRPKFGKTSNQKMIFIADPDQTLTWEREPKDDGMGFGLIELKTWSKAFVSKWMDEIFLSRKPQEVETLLRLTGGWPMELHKLGVIYHEVQDWKESIDRYSLRLTPEFYKEQFGIEDQILEIFRYLAEWSSTTPDSGTFHNDAYAEPLPEDTIISELPEGLRSSFPLIMRWAERLDYVRRTTLDDLQLNRIFLRLAEMNRNG